MKNLTNAIYYALLLVMTSNLAHAEGLRAGSWRIDTYEGKKLASTYNFCVSSGQTWSTAGPISLGPVTSGVTVHGPLIPGHGGWARSGTNITLYGTIGEAIQGAAFTAIGHMVGETSFLGRYVNFNIEGDWPNGLSGTIKASYSGQVCPF
jgi:hypothetical protein